MMNFILTNVLKTKHTGLFGGCFSSSIIFINILCTSKRVYLFQVQGEWCKCTEVSGQSLASVAPFISVQDLEVAELGWRVQSILGPSSLHKGGPVRWPLMFSERRQLVLWGFRANKNKMAV